MDPGPNGSVFSKSNRLFLSRKKYDVRNKVLPFQDSVVECVDSNLIIELGSSISAHGVTFLFCVRGSL